MKPTAYLCLLPTAAIPTTVMAAVGALETNH